MCFHVYLPRHDWLGTTLHAALSIAAIGSGMLFYRAATATLRRELKPSLSWKQSMVDTRGVKRGAIVLVMCVVFEEVDLQQFNFSRSNLKESEFRQVDLQKADFSRVNLQKAKLHGNLSGVNLSGADLRGVEITNSNIGHANTPKSSLILQSCC